MKIVVGLGNPGREYAATRHNIGFMVVDEFAARLGALERRGRFRAQLAEGFDNGEKLVVVKPQTFMNLSGISVREAVSWYKIATEDLLVVADDIDLPFGASRMRPGGGSGGHNGIKSILEELGTDQVPRLRIGIGRGRGGATRQVLTRFTSEEEAALGEIIDTAADCVQTWARQGIIAAMNRCNRRPDATIEKPAEAKAMTAAGDPIERKIEVAPAR